jgi:hypothetical protein
MIEREAGSRERISSTSFTLLCPTKAVVLIDDLVDFARRRAHGARSVIVRHGEKTTPTTKPTQSGSTGQGGTTRQVAVAMEEFDRGFVQAE